MEQVRLAQLGVTVSRFAASPHRLAPHIARPIDALLADALTALSDQKAGRGRLVVVQGERLAGTTHALAHALRKGLPTWKVVAFADEQEIALSVMVERAATWAEPGSGVVVWLDAISLKHLAQLTEPLLTGLPPQVVIAATVHTEELTGPDGKPAARLASPVPALLDEHAIHFTLGMITPAERHLIRAEPAYQELVPAVDEVAVEVLMGHLMIALETLRHTLTPTSGEQAADRVALLRAVTDWQRAQMPAQLTRKALQELWKGYRLHMSGLPPHTRLPAKHFTRALAWAGTEASAGRPQLISAAGPYRPHPLLAVVATEQTPAGWPISPPLWDYALCHLNESDLLKLGYTALDHDNPAAAALLLDALPIAIITPRVLAAMARHFYDRNDHDAARHWWVQAVKSGHFDHAPAAMVGLGLLESEQGQVEQAHHWWVQAVESGHPDRAPRAMVNLGILEEQQGRVEQARDWYLQAAESGHPNHAPTAMVNLAALEEEQGQVKQAHHWRMKAIESGEPANMSMAMLGLGLLESEQGRVDQARHWYLQAIESGHPDHALTAMVNLAVLESERGRREQAYHWWVQAVESGHPDHAPMAMIHLGLLEEDQGKLDQACYRYLQAVESCEPGNMSMAMLGLGILESEQGRVDQARHWYLQAIESGHPDHAPTAMVNLGILEIGQGRVDQARHWYLQAIESGHPDHAPTAMVNLGILEIGQGRVDQARHWYLQAIESGHPDHAPTAMVNLGLLEQRQGQIERAQGRHTKAMKSEHPEAADHARLALTTDASSAPAQYSGAMGDIEVREQGQWAWVTERRSLVGTPPPKALQEADAFIDQFWPESKAS
ncbi:tetratricopeptide repeat protein [Streptosporangium sp. CA-115845]|uniref:tetratricopeptide repeat protein n=1 Tax=Streptosporangium sp. CA-115845 TaxID=3240071 RepID=UPI003D8CCE8D